MILLVSSSQFIYTCRCRLLFIILYIILIHFLYIFRRSFAVIKIYAFTGIKLIRCNNRSSSQKIFFKNLVVVCADHVVICITVPRPNMSGFTIPSEYAWILMECAIIVTQCMTVGYANFGLRKRLFTKQFFDQNFPHIKPAPEAGYPDNGSGRFAQN